MFKQVNYGSKILIATTVVGWKCKRNEHLNWLQNRKDIKSMFPNSSFFCSLEIDQSGLDPFMDILRALGEVGGEYWTYYINDHIKKVGSQNRWIRIETGRNLIREYAQRNTWSEKNEEQTLGPKIEYDAILFVDSDIVLTIDIIEKLLEVDNYAVGATVHGYDLKGDDIEEFSNLQKGGSTIATLLINSPAYFYLPFHHNSYMKINDDFTLQDTLIKQFGPIIVRKDAVSVHHGTLVNVENREIEDRKL